MKELTEEISSTWRKIKANNPQKRFAWLPVGIYVQMQDFRWQAVVSKGDDGIYRLLEKEDPKLYVSQVDFMQLFMPSAIELSWAAATNN